jgi:hypothetical protein
MTKRTLLISIPVVALVLNGVGYMVVRAKRSAPKAVATGPSADSPGARGVTTNPPEAPAATRADEGDADRARSDRALARRAAGLAALEAGDYQKALINFTEAKSLLGPRARVDELLRVTEELSNNPAGGGGNGARARAARAAVAPAPEVSVTEPPARQASRGARRRVVNEPAAEIAPEEAPPPPSGLLIVTTTPRGLLVQVDDTAVDLTPMRTRVKPGGHRIALLDGERKVYETTVDVKDGAIATLTKDVSLEHPPEWARPASGSTASPGGGRERSDSATPPPAVVAAAPTSPSPDPLPPGDFARARNIRPTAEGSGSTGALAISAPGLYGVVWINGRPRGYAPMEVRDLPAGPVKLEVRVNGVQKRATTALVRPGTTTAVKIGP